MKIRTIQLLTNIYMLIKNWNEGVFREEKDFLIPLRETLQELAGELEDEGLDIYNSEGGVDVEVSE